MRGRVAVSTQARAAVHMPAPAAVLTQAPVVVHMPALAGVSMQALVEVNTPVPVVGNTPVPVGAHTLVREAGHTLAPVAPAMRAPAVSPTTNGIGHLHIANDSPLTRENMDNNTSGNPADLLYAEGMKYDWRQSQSPASATLARAAFQQAATVGHTKAIRALAHMTYEGNGGGQDREQALLLLWFAFLRGDHDSLEELADMLESYAEATADPETSINTAKVAQTVEELSDRLTRVRGFMHELLRERSIGSQTT